MTLERSGAIILSVKDQESDTSGWRIPGFICSFFIGLVVSTPIYLMNWYAYEPKEEPQPVIMDSEAANRLQELIKDASEEHSESSRSGEYRPTDTRAQRKLETFLRELRNAPPPPADVDRKPGQAK